MTRRGIELGVGEVVPVGRGDDRLPGAGEHGARAGAGAGRRARSSRRRGRARRRRRARSAANRCSASSRASTAARCSPCDPNRRRSRPPGAGRAGRRRGRSAAWAAARRRPQASHRARRQARPRSRRRPRARHRHAIVLRLVVVHRPVVRFVAVAGLDLAVALGPPPVGRVHAARRVAIADHRLQRRPAGDARGLDETQVVAMGADQGERATQLDAASFAHPVAERGLVVVDRGELGHELEGEALAGRGERRGRFGEAVAQLAHQRLASPAQLDRRPCELHVPRIECRRRRPGAHVRELRVALPQSGLQIARRGRVGHGRRRGEGVKVRAPPRRAALHEQQALGNEDEHLPAATQLVEVLDLEPVPAGAFALAGRVGDLDPLRVALAAPVDRRPSRGRSARPSVTSFSSRLVRGEPPRRAK